MGQTSEKLKAEIADRRADMSEVIDQLGNKLSPRQAAQRRVGRVRDRCASVAATIMGSANQAGEAVQGLKHNVTDRTQDIAGSVQSAPQSAPQAARSSTQGNPLAAGLIAFGGGLLLASILPATKTERQMASSVSQQARPLVEEAKHAAADVKDNLQDSAKGAAQELKDTVSDSAHQVTEDARSSGREIAGATKGAVGEVASRRNG